ncbi:hypothetical protein COOONC_17666 [Cooperia oncophora]
MYQNVYLQKFESEEFCIEPPSAAFQKKDTRGLRAKFDDMVSLPFAVLVGPKSDVEARLFLERSFADLVSGDS